MSKEALYKVYLEFYVVAKDEDEASDCVQMTPQDRLDFNVKSVLDERATEEAISFLTQLESTHVDRDTQDKVIMSYLIAKGVGSEYIEVLTALRRAIRERRPDVDEKWDVAEHINLDDC